MKIFFTLNHSEHYYFFKYIIKKELLFKEKVDLVDFYIKNNKKIL